MHRIALRLWTWRLVQTTKGSPPTAATPSRKTKSRRGTERPQPCRSLLACQRVAAAQRCDPAHGEARLDQSPPHLTSERFRPSQTGPAPRCRAHPPLQRPPTEKSHRQSLPQDSWTVGPHSSAVQQDITARHQQQRPRGSNYRDRLGGERPCPASISRQVRVTARFPPQKPAMELAFSHAPQPSLSASVH
jgi:hypothetical protein